MDGSGGGGGAGILWDVSTISWGHLGSGNMTVVLARDQAQHDQPFYETKPVRLCPLLLTLHNDNMALDFTL